MATARTMSGLGYLSTYVGLVLLATASLLLSFLHWPGGVIVALTIAVVKALLVLWFFMHLSSQHFSSGLAILVAAMFIALLTGLVAADVATRHTFPARPRPAGDESFYKR